MKTIIIFLFLMSFFLPYPAPAQNPQAESVTDQAINLGFLCGRAYQIGWNHALYNYPMKMQEEFLHNDSLFLEDPDMTYRCYINGYRDSRLRKTGMVKPQRYPASRY